MYPGHFAKSANFVHALCMFYVCNDLHYYTLRKS